MTCQHHPMGPTPSVGELGGPCFERALTAELRGAPAGSTLGSGGLGYGNRTPGLGRGWSGFVLEDSRARAPGEAVPSDPASAASGRSRGGGFRTHCAAKRGGAPEHPRSLGASWELWEAVRAAQRHRNTRHGARTLCPVLVQELTATALHSCWRVLSNHETCSCPVTQAPFLAPCYSAGNRRAQRLSACSTRRSSGRSRTRSARAPPPREPHTQRAAPGPPLCSFIFKSEETPLGITSPCPVFTAGVKERNLLSGHEYDNRN